MVLLPSGQCGAPFLRYMIMTACDPVPPSMCALVPLANNVSCASSFNGSCLDKEGDSIEHIRCWFTGLDVQMVRCSTCGSYDYLACLGDDGDGRRGCFVPY
eukprot:5818627-Amphidinium_carterae.1